MITKIFNKNLLRMKLFKLKKENREFLFDLRTNENEKEHYYKSFQDYRGEVIFNSLSIMLKEDYKIEQMKIAEFNYKNEDNLINLEHPADVWVECILTQDKTDKIELKLLRISRRFKKTSENVKK